MSFFLFSRQNNYYRLIQFAAIAALSAKTLFKDFFIKS